MSEDLYLYNDAGQKYLYHKIYEANIDRELDGVLPSTDQVKDVVLHWSAGNYGQMYQHYQCNITDKAIAIVDKSKIFSWTEFAHTYHRNTGRIGVSFCAMYDSKKAPVTILQISMLIKVLTTICKKYNLNPYINITSHAEWARVDGYSSLRWDIETHVNYGGKKQILTDYIRDKVFDELENKHNIVHPPVTTPKPVPLPDKYITKSSFTDIKPTDWFSWQTEFCYQNKLLVGNNPSGTGNVFNVGKNITRKEIVCVFNSIIKFLEQKSGKKLTPIITTTLPEFTDVLAIDWYYDSLVECDSRGLIVGSIVDSQLYFKPDGELTRSEFATMITGLVRYLTKENLIKSDIDTPIKFEDRFQDVSIKDWYQQQILWTSNKSILVGSKTEMGSFFNPNDKIKRENVAVGIYKLIKYINNASGLNIDMTIK